MFSSFDLCATTYLCNQSHFAWFMSFACPEMKVRLGNFVTWLIYV